MLTNLKLVLGLALALLILGLAAWGNHERNRANSAQAQVQALTLAHKATEKALANRSRELKRIKSIKERTDADLSQALQAHPDWSTSPVPDSISCRVRLDPSACPSQ